MLVQRIAGWCASSSSVKISILAEGIGDVAFLRAVVTTICRQELQFQEPRLSSRPKLDELVGPVLKQAHYGGDDAVLIVADLDDSAWNADAEQFQAQLDLQAHVEEILRGLPGRNKNEGLRVVVVVAVPCREAWLEFLLHGNSSEASWLRQLREKRQRGSDARRALKRKVYGTERPTRSREQEILEKAVGCLKENGPDALFEYFPRGLGPLRQFFDQEGVAETER